MRGRLPGLCALAEMRSGNRPMLASCIGTLRLAAGRCCRAAEALPVASEPARVADAVAERPPARVVFFDLETQRSAEEVGGWHNAHLMRVSLGVLYDAATDRFETYREADVSALIDRLATADLVVGFNVRRFDYHVLRGYTDRDLSKLPTFDLLEALHGRLGFRVSLGHLATETLGSEKSADGLQALEWWKNGRLVELERTAARTSRCCVISSIFRCARAVCGCARARAIACVCRRVGRWPS